MVHGRQSVTDLNARVSRAGARGRRGEPTVRGQTGACAAIPSWKTNTTRKSCLTGRCVFTVQARETVHNLRGYKNKFMTNKPKDSIQVKNDDSVKLLFLQTLDFINVIYSL